MTPDHDIVVEDDVEALLHRLQRAVLLHPIAAQALVRALMVEGRAWATTPEGHAWRERLRHADLVVRARVLWDALTVRAIEDDEATVVPSAVLEAFVKAASEADTSELLESLFVRGVFGGRAA